MAHVLDSNHGKVSLLQYKGNVLLLKFITDERIIFLLRLRDPVMCNIILLIVTLKVTLSGIG